MNQNKTHRHFPGRGTFVDGATFPTWRVSWRKHGGRGCFPKTPTFHLFPGLQLNTCRWWTNCAFLMASRAARFQQVQRKTTGELGGRALVPAQTSSAQGFRDGLGHLRLHQNPERLSESGLRARQAWPGEEPVRAGVGPNQEERRVLQRVQPDRAAKLAPVAVRGPEQTGLQQAKYTEEGFWRSAGRWVRNPDGHKSFWSASSGHFGYFFCY